MNRDTTARTERASSGSERGDIDSSYAGAPGDDVQSALVPREQAALDRVRTLSGLLDESIRVPGTNFRFGLDPILGIVPVGGDAVATIFALYPILEAARFGAPIRTLAKMVLFVAVDSVIGSIPALGTVFDAAWKANKWNTRILERQLAQR